MRLCHVLVLCLTAALQACPLPIPGETRHSPYVVGSFHAEPGPLAGAKVRIVGDVERGVCEGALVSEAETGQDGSFWICPAVKKRKFVLILPGAAHMMTRWNLCVFHEGAWQFAESSSFYAPAPAGAFGVGKYRCELSGAEISCESSHLLFVSPGDIRELPGSPDCGD